MASVRTQLGMPTKEIPVLISGYPGKSKAQTPSILTDFVGAISNSAEIGANRPKF
jgi:hypothetical protein